MIALRKTLLFLVPMVFKLGRRTIETAHQPQDAAALQALYARITQWCILNQFLIPAATAGRYVPNIATNDLDSKIRTYIYTLNFKRLCVRDYLTEALEMFEDTDFDRTTSRLFDLHLRLVTEIDSRVLNLYINNLTYGLKALYPSEEDEVVTWEEIFTAYPYLWLLFPIQQVLRDATPILDG